MSSHAVRGVRHQGDERQLAIEMCRRDRREPKGMTAKRHQRSAIYAAKSGQVARPLSLRFEIMSPAPGQTHLLAGSDASEGTGTGQ